MDYAKLIDKYPIFAPKHLHIDNYVIYNPPAETYLQQGWLPVIYTDMPEEIDEGYYCIEQWFEDDNKIIQGWQQIKEEQE